MAEKDKSSGASQNDLLNRLGGSDWGDDWESAFESEGAGAEEDLDDDSAAEALLFDDDEDDEDGLIGESVPGDAAGAGVARAGEGAAVSFGFAALLSFLLSLPERFFVLLAKIWPRRDKDSPLSTRQKLFAALLMPGLLFFFFLVYRFLSPPEPTQIVLPEDPFSIGELREPGEPLFPDEVSRGEEMDRLISSGQYPDELALLVIEEEFPELEEPKPLPQPELRRIQLPDFYIPVEGRAATGELTFIELDLNVVIELPGGEEPDPLLSPLLRDSTYRFYTSKDRERLTRYTLARGEMNRELRGWLEKKHPELVIDSISFGRYRLSMEPGIRTTIP